ncbi:MAG: hypothetical protein Q7T03_03510 [Deltaproteobacteria bacterium]|nr:hypothetical protein [Deltaproteobacteria bacterium]
MQKILKIVAPIFLALFLFSTERGHANPSVGNVDDSVAVEQVTLSLDGKLFAWDAKGNVLSGWPVSLSQKVFILSPRLVDLDGDGRKELVAVSQGQDNSIELNVFNGLGQAMPGWNQHLTVGTSNLNDTPVIADINGDSILEIAYATADGNLYLQKKTGESLSGFPQAVVVSRLMVADLENDGKPKLYSTSGGTINKWTVNAETGNLESNIFFQTPGNFEIIGEPAVGDINVDRRNEIIFSTSQNNIFIIDASGRTLRQIPVVAQLPLHSQVVLGDVNADGRADIVASLNDGTRVAFQGDGSSIRNWIGEAGFRRYRQPAIGKVANDLYDGTVASATGWDFYTLYLSGLKTFAVIEMGSNVHEFDRMAPLHFAQAAEIDEVAVRPMIFTPNGDGNNDTAELHYTLSQPAYVSIDLYDSHEQFLSNLTGPKSLGIGQNVEVWDGYNRQGTLTTNDDKLLSSGTYLLKITATTNEGLVSTAMTKAVLFGINAEIEFPKDAVKTDETYPEIWGTVALKGVAVDPAVGEGQSGFDFNSYKLYFRPGAWVPSAEEVAAVGRAGSGWSVIAVPLKLQSPVNLRNEPGDSVYPQSNVSVGTVQHGVLGAWNTSGLSNGIYTVLLKVIDGDLTGAHRISFDHVTVQVANAVAGAGQGGDGSSGDDESGGSGGAGGTGQSNNQIGPAIQNVNPTSAELTETVRQANIRYTLVNKPSDINITVYRATGDGSVVYTQSFLNRAPEQTYLFAWNGLDNLKRQVSNGTYRVRIEASATDGLGFDSNESVSLTINTNDALSSDLSVVNFAASMTSFNPLDFNAETPHRSAALTYILSKPARVTMEILDADGAVRRRLLNNLLSQNSGDNPPVWDGTGDDHLVLPFGAYRCRLIAVGTEAGRPETIVQELELQLAQSERDGNIVAAISKLVGDGKKNAANDQERGVLDHDADANNDFPLEGNPDFEWEASGSGTIVPELEYRIIGAGEERYQYIIPRRREYRYRSGCFRPDPYQTEICPRIRLEFDNRLLLSSAGATILDVGTKINSVNHVLYSEIRDLFGGSELLWNRFYTSGIPAGQTITFPLSVPGLNYPDLPIGLSFYSSDYEDFEALYFITADEPTFGTRPWGPVNTGWVARSGLNSGVNDIGGFSAGSIGTGAGDVVAITSQNYTYEVREKLNNQYRSVGIDACDNGKKALPFVEMWMGNNTGPDTTNCQSNSPSIFANVLQGAFSTSQDTVLNDTGGKIRGSFSHFNEEGFRVLSNDIKIKDSYPTPESYPDLYTFSNAVRINRWDVGLKYPNGDVVDAFEVVNKNLHGQSALDQDVNGLPDANDAVLDTFQIKMKPDVAARRFVEIVGNVGAQNYQLKFYDAATQSWQDIPKQLSVPKEDGTQTLAWWDVTKLNGENYTVLLRVEGEEGRINEDIMNVGVGKKVVRGEMETVKDAFGRASLNFAPNSLSAADTLVSVAAVKTDDPSLPVLNLPDGTVPMGPVYNLKPDGIAFDPAHPVQMELTYTCEEVWNAFGGNPAEITIYNLKENGELEKVSTIQSSGDSCAAPDPNQLFTVTAMLEHFSMYLPLKQGGSIPTFNVTAPTKNGLFASPLKITGQVSGPDLESLKISYYPVGGNPLSTTLIYEESAKVFDFNWETTVPSGDYVLVFEAANVEGVSNFLELPVHLDIDPPLTKMLVDGTAVAENAQVYITPESAISFVSEDGGNEITKIEYKLDAGAYADYTSPFKLSQSAAGKHQIFYRSVDATGNEEPSRQVTLVLRSLESAPDGSHVETGIVAFGPSFQNNGQTWVGRNSSLAIGAVQGSTELADIFYRQAGNSFDVYESPVLLNALTEGAYSLEYYGEDIYQRAESAKYFAFNVDNTPPELAIALNGRHQETAENYLINAQTEIALSASDKEMNASGVKKIEYRFGGNVWNVYSTPVKVPDAQHATLEVRAIDNVNTTSVVKTYSFKFDTTAPQASMGSADAAFSPNQDGVKDIMTAQMNISDNFSEKLFVTFKIDDRFVWNAKETDPGAVTMEWDGNIDGESLPEGNHSYEIFVEDEAGNRSEILRGAVGLDLTPPVLGMVYEMPATLIAGLQGVSVAYSLSDNLASGNVQVALSILSGGDQVLAGVADTVAYAGVALERNIAWNGQNMSTNALPDGDYHYRLVATDAAGNISEALSGVIGLDQTRPVTTLKIQGPTSGGWVGPLTDLMLEAFDTGLGVQSTYYQLNGSVPQTYSSPVRLNQSGDYQFGYFSRDLAGNEEFIRVQALKVDATSPQSQVSWDGINRSLNDKTHISGKTKIVLAGEDAESGLDKILLTLDGVGPSVYATPLALGNYGDGWHTLKLQALDKVGNKETEQEIVFYLHGTPPEISVEMGDPKYNSYVTSQTPIRIGVRSNNPAITHVEYRLDAANPIVFTPQATTAFTIPEFLLPEDGSHTLVVRASDDYENQSEKSISIVVDNTAPETTLEQSQQITGDENFISPSTKFTLDAHDSASGVKVTEYKVNGDDWKNYSQPFDLKELSDGEHHIFYRSKDNLANEERSKEQIVSLQSVGIISAVSSAPRVLVYLVGEEDKGQVSDLVEELFEAQPWHYSVVTENMDFIQKLRGGEFNVVAFATEQPSYRFAATLANDKIFKELAARVAGGLGVVVLADKGGLTGVPWDNLMASVRPGKEKLVQFDVNPAMAIAALLGDARDNAKKDLAAQFEASVSAKTGWAPLDVAALEAVISTKEKELNIGVKMTLPEELTLLKVLGGSKQGRSAEWVEDIAANQTKKLRYLVRLPAVRKNVSWKMDTETVWIDGLTYNKEVPVEISLDAGWEEVWEAIISKIKQIVSSKEPSDKAHIVATQLLERFEPPSPGAAKAVGGTLDMELRMDILLDAFQKFPLLGKEEETEALRDLLLKGLDTVGLQTVESGKALSGFSQSALDTDNDGIADDVELSAKLNPNNPDSDGDGVSDGKEKSALSDSDGDGLINALDTDSDNDGLSDGQEDKNGNGVFEPELGETDPLDPANGIDKTVTAEGGDTDTPGDQPSKPSGLSRSSDVGGGCSLHGSSVEKNNLSLILVWLLLGYFLVVRMGHKKREV